MIISREDINMVKKYNEENPFSGIFFPSLWLKMMDDYFTVLKVESCDAREFVKTDNIFKLAQYRYPRTEIGSEQWLKDIDFLTLVVNKTLRCVCEAIIICNTVEECHLKNTLEYRKKYPIKTRLSIDPDGREKYF